MGGGGLYPTYLKIFLFSKSLNMVKNENVLLDPNSKALWGGQKNDYTSFTQIFLEVSLTGKTFDD